VKGSLFNEDMSLHEAGVDGVVHEVVGMYCARVDGVFHGCYRGWIVRIILDLFRKFAKLKLGRAN
jgi:hypothetical protein